MRDQTCFQDWETIILKKQTVPPKSIESTNLSASKTNDENDIVKPMKVSNELKLAIQQARVNRKLSQKQLASMMSCQPSIINQYESGKAIPNNSFISKLEQKLKTRLPRAKKEKI